MEITEQRKKVKAERMLEKAMRTPINDVVLEVQKGTIDIKDLFNRIEEKVREVANG
jgi:hypothetical protein